MKQIIDLHEHKHANPVSICNHAELSHTFLHNRPRHAQQLTAWHEFTFQPLSTCARTSGRWGPAYALPVSTGHGADEQRARSHLGTCLFCHSPWALRGLLRVTHRFCFLF